MVKTVWNKKISPVSESKSPRLLGGGNFLKNLFRERQIYMRADGKLMYLPLKSYVQVVFFIFMFIVLGTGVYTAFNIFDKNRTILTNNQRYYNMKGDYEKRIDFLNRTVRALNEKIRTERSSYSGRIIDIAQMYENIETRYQELAQLLDSGDVFGHNHEDDDSDYSSDAIKELAQEVKLTISRVQQNIITITQSDVNRSKLLPRYLGSQNKVKQIVDKNVPKHLEEQIGRIGKTTGEKFGEVSKKQINLTEKLVDKISGKVNNYIIALSQVGFAKDAEKIVKQVKKLNKTELQNPPIGGPFIDASYGVDDQTNSISADQHTIKDEVVFRSLIERLRTHVETLASLRRHSTGIPIGKPIAAKNYISSGYGYRRDPFNRRRAMHSGIDFAAKMGAKIRATAKGFVSLSKYTGSYGLMIEVKHENGLTTRYAHLSKAFVRKGQKVKYNQILGLVGSTGRSTGAHLHYEVRKSGRTVDPMSFLKVGKYVQ